MLVLAVLVLTALRSDGPHQIKTPSQAIVKHISVDDLATSNWVRLVDCWRFECHIAGGNSSVLTARFGTGLTGIDIVVGEFASHVLSVSVAVSTGTGNGGVRLYVGLGLFGLRISHKPPPCCCMATHTRGTPSQTIADRTASAMSAMFDPLASGNTLSTSA